MAQKLPEVTDTRRDPKPALKEVEKKEGEEPQEVEPESAPGTKPVTTEFRDPPEDSEETLF